MVAPAAAGLRRALRLTLVLVAAAGSGSACSRAMHVGSEPAPVYRLVVSNEFPETMLVYYNDGRGDGLLGAVPAGRSETFVVAAPASPSVTVSARNAAGSRSFGPATTDLVLGGSVTVRLRP